MFDFRWKRLAVTTGAALALVVSSMPASALGGRDLGPDTRFYVRQPDHAAQTQLADLRSAGQKTDANALSWMLDTPQAVWITGGSARAAMQQVRQVVTQAADKGTVPVFVAYNIPYRDCAQYSSGGASNTAEYEAWIDGVVAGIGSYKAVVLLEPDSLGIIPFYKPLYSPMEWCQPTVGGAPAPEADPAHRFAQLNYAVGALEALPNTSVYLDATHSYWLGVGDMADRLIQAGVKNAQGFFTNVSNFQTTATSTVYGRWISSCIARTDKDSWWNPNWCPSQYDPAAGYQVNYDPAYVASVDAVFASWAVTPKAHFVIDTSRNGQGPWTPPAPFTEDWCNPVDRGLGFRATADTKVALLDAYLWVKTPGESDGQCTRGTAGPADPVRGYVDPVAGGWFPQMALELVHNANPALPATKAVPQK